ncbi:tetraacyldisaccharide 4'-kinase [Phreatobacter sp.]|uniref:tetraacyldisaccharide 4'-kinase n=1 Tax=Phreatobacter sp. TaxID=1966341 RepID=UPI003F6EB60B
MRAPAFWSEPDSLLARLLSPIGALVGAVTLARMARTAGTAPVPVICIGNPTVGGAGKSPAARLLADRLATAGRHPAILLRGHGGSERGPLRVDPDRHTAAQVGDEALVHARRHMTIVARDRPAGAGLAAAGGADVIVMDDGFQNPSLAKTLSILVVDAAFGLGNGRVLPAGPLRAPLRPQMKRADALMLVGDGEAGEVVAQAVASMAKPVLRVKFVPDPLVVGPLAGRDVLAFCGIGRPAKFAETLGAAGLRNVLLRPFPDHHVYTDIDAEGLLAEQSRTGLPLVTTEKDAVKLAGSPALVALAAASIVVPAELREADPALLDRLLAPLSGTPA